MVDLSITPKPPWILERAKEIVERCRGLTHEGSHLCRLVGAVQNLCDTVASLDAFSKGGADVVFFTAKKTLKVIEYLEEDLLLSDTQIGQIGIVENTVAALRTVILSYERCAVPAGVQKSQYIRKLSEAKAQLKNQCKNLREKSRHMLSDDAVNTIALVSRTMADAFGNTPAAPLKALANVVAEACLATMADRVNKEVSDELHKLSASIKRNLLDTTSESFPGSLDIGARKDIILVLSDVYRLAKQLRKRRNTLKRLLSAERDKQRLQELRTRLTESVHVFTATMTIQIRSEILNSSKTAHEMHEHLLLAVNAVEAKTSATLNINHNSNPTMPDTKSQLPAKLTLFTAFFLATPRD